MTTTKHYDKDKKLTVRQEYETMIVMPQMQVSRAAPTVNILRASLHLPSVVMDRILRAAIDSMSLGAERSLAIEMQNELSHEIERRMRGE